MSSTPASYDQLIHQFVTDHLLPEQVDQFFLFLEQEDFRAHYGEHIDTELLKTAFHGWANSQQGDELYQRILRQGGIGNQSISLTRKPFYNKAWFRYAAAVLVLVTAGMLYLMNRSQPASVPSNEIAEQKELPAKPILPAGNKAVLTLSNGQQVSLENNAAGTINDGSLAIQQVDGQLIYGKNSVAADVTNTITTPNGGQYQLLLSDGTKVWLNAGSSITYPAAFTGSTRTVSIKGEVYFEVSTDKNRPFIVNTVKDQITVLGTAFNVNSYSDEPATKTTLVEGSVKVNEQLLKPGQASVDGKIIAANVQQDIAWKAGYFDFTGLPFDQALRQLARWYDLQIVYQNEAPRDLLKGKMERNMTLTDAIAGLNGMLANVKVRLENRTILVKSILR
ncbi:FecR family protein [Pseudoflavitalea sp. G-6-1-2]|uniref:FecR family protein n=1 Tax=Pseudoflavitalea sp. G-6-1-2 TaxID=2728841 RepID=UPI00146A72C4|nr:FecR domain-containing protein [Pseudoflavitalea sp. G-6-1-2]NML22334.1 FecR family protein [Pseudoflavitalea sp. G-6-1-2]